MKSDVVTSAPDIEVGWGYNQENYTEVNVDFSALKTMLATFGNRKIGLTNAHTKTSNYEALLNHYETEDDSFLGCIVTSDAM